MPAGLFHPKTMQPLGMPARVKLLKQALETGKVPEELTGPDMLDLVHDELPTPSKTPAAPKSTGAQASASVPQPLRKAASNLLYSESKEELDELGRILDELDKRDASTS